MTDNEIVKALECCKKPVPDCDCCPIERRDMCFDFLKEAAIDLINRQKAEIERLKVESANIVARTLKRFEKEISGVGFTLGQTWEIKCALKNVFKEMTGDKKNV